uniref:PAS domain-containing protein n=1 Tax=Tetraodon nigroviridis TaxID=99883 RepID=H3CID5_TETNG
MFGHLSHLLPLQASVRQSLDRPSVIRLTLSYIRAHALLKGSASAGGSRTRTRPVCAFCLEQTVLEGFLMVLSTGGDVVFVSENVSQHMGLTQAELMGHNVFEFTHPCDHEEIRTHLQEAWSSAERDFVTRMKSALTCRGRSASLKSAAWKVLRCRGRAKARFGPPGASCLLLTCQPLPLSHTLLSTHTFTSQHSMDMRFTHVDYRCSLACKNACLRLGVFTRAHTCELLGRSVYQLCHPLDAASLARSHLDVCLKSLSVSGRYRVLAKGGGYVWVETHGAVVPGVQPSRSRPAAPQRLCVLCVTYVLR